MVFIKNRNIRIAVIGIAVTLVILLAGINTILFFPKIQTHIASTIVKQLNDRYNLDIHISGIRIQLPSKVTIKDLLINDTKNDSLFYVKEAGIKADLFKAIFKDEYIISSFETEQTKVKLKRLADSSDYNFTALVNTFKADTAKNKSEKSKQIKFQVKNINLKETFISYYDYITTDSLILNLNELILKKNQIDIEKKLLSIDEIFFGSEKIVISTLSTNNQDKTKRSPVFGWKVKLGELDVSVKDIIYSGKKVRKKPSGFDLNNLVFKDFSTILKNIELSDKLAQADIKSFAFIESGGFELNSFNTKALIDTTGIFLKNTKVETPNSYIKTNLQFGLNSFDPRFILDNNIPIRAEIEPCVIHENDLFYFYPSLKENEKISSLFQKNELKIAANLNGSLGKLNCFASINKKDFFALEIAGELNNLHDFANFNYSVSNLNLKIQKEQYGLFVDDLVNNQNLVYPDKISVNGKAWGTLDAINSNITIGVSNNTIKLHTSLSNINSTSPKWKGNIGLLNFNIYDFYNIDNKHLPEKISLSGNFNGKGLSMETLQAKADILLKSASIHGSEYSDMEAKAEYKANMAHLQFISNNELLNGQLTGSIDLSKEKPNYEIEANISGLDVSPFVSDSSQYKLAGKMHLNAATTGPNNVRLKLRANNINAVLNNKSISTDSITVNYNTDTLSSELVVNSDFVQGAYTGKLPIHHLYKNTINHINYYFTLTDTLPKNPILLRDYKLNFEVSDFSPLQAINNNKLPQLGNLRFSSEGNANINTSATKVKFSNVTYKGLSTDTILLSLFSDTSEMDYSILTGDLRYDSLIFNNLSFSGSIARDTISTNLKLINNNNTSLGISGFLSKHDSIYCYNLSEKGLVIDNKPWIINKNNSIIFGANYLFVNRLELENRLQKIAIQSQDKNIPDSPFELEVENLDLVSFSKIFNVDSILFQGKFNSVGKISKLNSDSPEVHLNANIKDSYYKSQKIGNISLDINNTVKDELALSLNYKENKSRFSIIGKYTTTDKEMNMNLVLENFDLSVMSPFTENYLTELSGTVSGNSKILGTIQNPNVDGEIKLTEAHFTPTLLKVPFYTKQGLIKFNEQQVEIKEFVIIDENKSKASVNGFLSIDKLNLDKANLQVKANNIMLLNTEQKDNELFFGKLFLDTDISIKGSIVKPEVTMSAKVNKGSKLTYIVPDNPDIIEEKSLVQFSSPSDSAKNNVVPTSQTNLQDFIGIDLTANLGIDEETEITIILDKYSGDYLKLQGTAKNFNYRLKPDGDYQMFGKYEIQKGNYYATFYDIATRNFIIDKGSSVVWSGDPMDASLDIKAIYKVKASPVDLLSNRELNQQVFNKTDYKQSMPFNIYLNIKEQLTEPQLSFAINQDEGNMALRDQKIISTLSKLNSTDSELNRQVFGLLLFGQFLPQNTWLAGSEKNAIRDKVQDETGKYLSNYLNKFANKNLPWFQVDASLDLNRDYNGGQPSNQAVLDLEISKQLFNNRLIIKVGESINLQNPGNNPSNTENLAGDIVIEYLLTKDGTYKLISSRKKNYNNIIDGELIENSIGVSFTKTMSKKVKSKKSQ